MAMGRPRKTFRWAILDSLVQYGAELDYVCEVMLKDRQEEEQRVLGVATTMIDHRAIATMRQMVLRNIERKHKMTFVEYRNKTKSPIKIKLAKKQIDLALDGNVTMLIWLGKQMLGQSDKHDAQVQESSHRTIKYVAMQPTGEEVEVPPASLTGGFKADQE
jgi:hypothetical protein